MFLSILLIISIFALIYKIFLDFHSNFVKENSTALRLLREINGRYSFLSVKTLSKTYTYDNENFFVSISCKDHLIYQLQFQSNVVIEETQKARKNAENYEAYARETASCQMGKYAVPTGWLFVKWLNHIEQQKFLKNCYDKPVTFFSFTVTLFYAKMNGVICDRKVQTFDEPEIFAIIDQMKNKNGSFYCDKEIWDAICRVERGKVSNKMRFSIYKRDGYRCRYCGRAQQFAMLEIDHIVPISKGGKSTYDNLQTLCHECNVKKGNKL